MTKRLAVVLTEGYADWEGALLMATARHEKQAETVVLTPKGADITSFGGIRVKSAGAAERAEPDGFDALVLVGGMIWQSPNAPDLSGLIGRFVEARKVVAAICDATIVLARRGLLDDRAHTGNFAAQLAGVEGYHGAAHYRDQPQAVTDRGIITASGCAPVTFAGAVLTAIGLGSEDLTGYLAMYGAEHQPAA